MFKTHRPCFVLSIVLMMGIAAGKSLPFPLWAWLLLSVAGSGLFFMRRAGGVLYALVFCLGAVSIQQRDLLPPNSVAFLSVEERESIAITEGVVDSDITHQKWFKGEKAVFTLNVRRILAGKNWRNACGAVQVELYGNAVMHYGDLIQVGGKPHAIFNGDNKNGFSYRKYLQDQGIYWIISVGKDRSCRVLSPGHGHIGKTWAMWLRHYMEGIFYRYLAANEAGFTAALVLGDHNGMPKDLKQIFVNTGTAHILAISGMNMTIVTAVCFFILRLLPWPRWVPFAGTVVFLFIYAFVSGWSASVVRACIMGSVILLSFAFEQEGEPLNSLGIAALILLMIDPKDLFDVGFQLSFAAVAAILILYARCRKIFAFLPEFLCASMSVSLAAWAGTAGLILYHFHMLTPISILANIPIVPLADLVMVLGLGLAAVGSWSVPLAHAFAGCLKTILSLMVIFAGWFNQVPYGYFKF